MIAAPLEESILGKAREKGLLRAQVTDIRDFAEGKHRITDDVPYGGGEGLLEGPHYPRPPEFRGMKVPEVLLSGDHARIAAWRREQAVRRTTERRPDLLKST